MLRVKKNLSKMYGMQRYPPGVVHLVWWVYVLLTHLWFLFGLSNVRTLVQSSSSFIIIIID